jgi:hypothetical protein
MVLPCSFANIHTAQVWNESPEVQDDLEACQFYFLKILIWLYLLESDESLHSSYNLMMKHNAAQV